MTRGIFTTEFNEICKSCAANPLSTHKLLSMLSQLAKARGKLGQAYAFFLYIQLRRVSSILRIDIFIESCLNSQLLLSAGQV